MKLEFIKVSPAKNMTIFIVDQVAKSEYVRVANKLLDYGSLQGEQVGFIVRRGEYLRLEMMGGEFCGNATRSLAAVILDRGLAPVEEEGQDFLIRLESSGLEGPVECRVRRTKDSHIYDSSLAMPPPLKTARLELEYGPCTLRLAKVDLPGIVHFVVEDRLVEDRMELFQLLFDEMQKEDYVAFGVNYFDYDNNFLTPLVYVRATDSLYWEKSCASGTAALGIVLAQDQASSFAGEIRQPGGNLTIEVIHQDGKLEEIYLSGLVKLVAEGLVYI